MKNYVKLVLMMVIVCFAVLGLVACDGKTEENSDGNVAEEAAFQEVYAQAREAGYTGTMEYFVTMFKGDNAYALARQNGYIGTEQEWLDSIANAWSKKGVSPVIGENGHWWVGELDTGVMAKDEKKKEISSIEKTSSNELIEAITIHYTDGTTQTYQVTNNSDGKEIESIQKTSSCTEDTYTIYFVGGKKETLIKKNNGGRHVYGNWSVVVEATAQENGIRVRTCTLCGHKEFDEVEFSGTNSEEIKFGLITLHDESSTYDKQFIDAAKAVCKELGVKIVVKTGIAESEACYQAAVDLVDQGCNIIFANSFGHEDYLIKAAKEFKNVQFFHASGTKAHTEKLANFHNAFANIYEGRYLAGVAAGMKLAAMKAADPSVASRIGYVAAFTYAEVISGYTSFYLGVKSIVADVTMEVTFTGSWYDPTAERAAAENLINRGAVIVSQHADSMGAPTACAENNVPNVTYNLNTQNDTPNTYLIGSRINWAVCYNYIINAVKNGEDIPYDWTAGLKEGAVELTGLNTAVAAEGTQAILDKAKAKIISGEIMVFGVHMFTVNGVELDETTMADVDTDMSFTDDTVVVVDGAFQESKFRSAPYFNQEIDGITLLDRNYGG